MPIGARILPMARNATLFEGVSSPSDDGAKRILGQTYEVADTLHNTCHRVILRAVQNDAGSAYTIPATGSTLFMKFQSTDVEDLGRKINGLQTSAGGICKPLDDYLSGGRGPTTVPDHDVCMVVEEGPCQVLKTSTSFTAGQAIMVTGTTGKACRATASDYIVGHAMTAYTAAATNCLIYVTGGLIMADKSA